MSSSQSDIYNPNQLILTWMRLSH